MKIFSKCLDWYIDRSNNAPILGLIFSNLNQENFRKFLKYTFIGAAISALLSIFFKFSIQYYFAFLVFSFIAYVGVLGIYNEKFRSSVLNSENSFENTIYILYFLTLVGVFGLVVAGISIFGLIPVVI